MEIDTNQIILDCMKVIQEKVENLATLNIIVAGKTGVGKINSVFRENLAEVGMGRPVTDHMRRISWKDFPLVVYDTKGFELGADVQDEVKNEVLKTIKNGLEANDISKAIHCVWYCINAASNRIEEGEIEWLRELSRGNEMTQVPIIVILTQCISKKKAQEMRRAIEAENLDIIQVIPVLAQDYEIDDDYVAKAFGLDVLIKVMSEALPDELLDTLHNLQIVSLDEKIKQAQKAVAAGTAAAVAAGASPIPISDCAVLIPMQVAMIARIAVIFGVDITKSMLASIVSLVLGAGGATIIGKTVVTNLLKLIPGAGSVAGGVISASTAGVLTSALGEAFIQIMAMIYKGELTQKDLETKKGKEQLRTIFKTELATAVAAR